MWHHHREDGNETNVKLVCQSCDVPSLFVGPSAWLSSVVVSLLYLKVNGFLLDLLDEVTES